VTSQPYTPVSKTTQKAAMSALANYVFAPDTLAAMQPLYTHLQHQRRGFSHFGKNEDPKGHKMVLNIQRSVLNQLLHPSVLQRMSDTALYGNDYSLSSYMQDLTTAIFVEQKSVNSMSQNLQIDYVERLIKVASIGKKSAFDNLAKTSALYQLQMITEQSIPWAADDTAKAHKAYLDLIIKKALEA
jgi:hypothetical protein